MRLLSIAIWLSISAATAAQAIPAACTACVVRAPAPHIGTGVPAMLVLGAALLGANLFARWRRS